MNRSWFFVQIHWCVLRARLRLLRMEYCLLKQVTVRLEAKLEFIIVRIVANGTVLTL